MRFTTSGRESYWDLRERFMKTYQAMQGEVFDPDELIFLDPEDPLISQLRSEVCRLPAEAAPRRQDPDYAEGADGEASF